MKNLVIVIGVILLLCSCSNNTARIEGKWQVIYTVPTDKNSSSIEQVAFAWLNILSDQSFITFKKDSLFINGKFQAIYKLKGNKLYYRKDNNFEKAYEFELKEDTMLLSNSEEGVMIKMSKKSP